MDTHNQRATGLHHARRTLRVLFIEPDAGVAAGFKTSLHARAGSGVGWDTVSSRSLPSLGALHEADLSLVDVIVTASTLPDACGLDLLAYIQGAAPDTPVILTGDVSDSAIAVEAIRGGAVEFVLQTGHESITMPLAIEKAFVHRQLRYENECLHADLGRSVSELAMVNRKLKKSIRRLEVTARTDELTGLTNRRWLNLMLEGRWAEVERHDLSLAFVMLDLDGFKQLNDRLGHQRGDDLLRVTGEVIRDNCRSIDVAARYGGDEFCLLMPHTSVDAAMQVALRIVEAFRERLLEHELGEVNLDVSIGISHSELSNPSCAEELVHHADEAMYAAKSSNAEGPRVMLRGAAGSMGRRAA